MYVTAKLLDSKESSIADLPLSVSKVKTFDDCKAKYRYTYIEKLPRKEWSFHIFGSFLHLVLEEFHGMSGEEDGTLMTKAFKKGLEEYGKKLDKGQKDEAWQILNKYLIQKANKEKHPDILGLEKGFYIDIYDDDKPHVLLNGFIDKIQRDPDGVVHVADYKTTKNKKYLNDFFQLLTYSYVLMLEDPKLEKVRASFILLRHDFEFMTKEYTRDDVMVVQEKFIEYAEKIQKEKLWRPNPKFLCKFCDHLERCEEGTEYLTKRNLIKRSDYGKTSY